MIWYDMIWYIYIMLSVGRCGVARLHMKLEHMDGMYRIIDGTSFLVKIK
jgi:hypothetical protein